MSLRSLHRTALLGAATVLGVGALSVVTADAAAAGC